MAGEIEVKVREINALRRIDSAQHNARSVIETEVSQLDLSLGLGWKGWPLWKNTPEFDTCLAQKKVSPNATQIPKNCLDCEGHAKHWDWKEMLKLLLFSLPGYIITGLAITLGAPFWFGVLDLQISIYEYRLKDR